MSSFNKPFFAGILWKLVLYVSSFLLNAFIAHKLGAANSGRFYYLLNNLSFVVLVLSLGFDTGVNYYNGAKEISRNSLFTLSAVFCIAASIAFAAAYCFVVHFQIGYHHVFNSCIIWYVAGSLSFNVFTAFYYSEHEPMAPNLISAACNVLLIALLPLVVFSNPQPSTLNPQQYVGIYLSMNLVAALLVVALLYTRGARFVAFNAKNILATGIVKFSLQSFVLAVLFTLLLRCDYWLVAHCCTKAETGNYLQTSKFVQLVMLLPSLASFSLFPLIVQSLSSGTGIEPKLVRLMNVYIYTSLFICMALAIAGQFLFPFIYGNTYDKMYNIFLLLIPGIVSMAATYPLTPYFSAKKMIHINLQGMAIAIAALLVADWLLIPRYTVFGAAIGCSLGYFAYLFFLLCHFKKQARFGLMELLQPKLFFYEMKLAAQKWRSKK